MRFILVGPNFGASGIWGGFHFRDGVCDVPQNGAENAAHLLSTFYSAYPEEEAEEKHFEYLDSLEPDKRKTEETKMKKFIKAHGGHVVEDDKGDEKHVVDLSSPPNAAEQHSAEARGLMQPDKRNLIAALADVPVEQTDTTASYNEKDDKVVNKTDGRVVVNHGSTPVGAGTTVDTPVTVADKASKATAPDNSNKKKG